MAEDVPPRLQVKTLLVLVTQIAGSRADDVSISTRLRMMQSHTLPHSSRRGRGRDRCLRGGTAGNSIKQGRDKE